MLKKTKNKNLISRMIIFKFEIKINDIIESI